jgi:PadR family transcriptional regulator
VTPSSVSPSRSVDSLLPLKPVETLILMMLAGGDRHGYGIRQDILEHSQGAIELEAAHLYRHIRHLESEDLLASPGPARAPAGADARRIYYRLTPFGRRVLAAEMLRLKALVRLAEVRHIIPVGA